MALVPEVWGFLGTVGIVHRWIKDFTKIAKPLTLLTKKMSPCEFKWTPQAERAMNILRDLAANAVPIRLLDFCLATLIQPKNQWETDLGLVTIQVDSSIIGIGWVINQQLEDQQYPIVFGSLTFNPIESRYSQPKLELYSVLRAFKAEWHRLHIQVTSGCEFHNPNGQCTRSSECSNDQMDHIYLTIQLWVWVWAHKGQETLSPWWTLMKTMIWRRFRSEWQRGWHGRWNQTH